MYDTYWKEYDQTHLNKMDPVSFLWWCRKHLNTEEAQAMGVISGHGNEGVAGCKYWGNTHFPCSPSSDTYGQPVCYNPLEDDSACEPSESNNNT